ncbi:hypothetical protein FRC05_007659 [Tulasnella sp. 425]|nr:hypothetical protein FRC05_007659 [Tulasnella sp. 425]
MADDLGQAGDSHTDDLDDLLALSVMSVGSKLRKGIDPGRFHLLELGFFVVLNPGLAVAFSGLHQHGGTAPVVPYSMDLDPSDIRATAISYPTKSIIEGNCNFAVYHTSSGATSSCSTNVLVPARIHTGSYEPEHPVPPNARTCFARNGQTCMDPQKLDQFLQRLRYQQRIAQAIQEGNSIDDLRPFKEWDLKKGESVRPTWELCITRNPEAVKDLKRTLALENLRFAELVPSQWNLTVNPFAPEDVAQSISKAYRLPLSLLDPCFSSLENLPNDNSDMSMLEGANTKQNAESSTKLSGSRRRLEYPGSLAPPPLPILDFEPKGQAKRNRDKDGPEGIPAEIGQGANSPAPKRAKVNAGTKKGSRKKAGNAIKNPKRGKGKGREDSQPIIGIRASNRNTGAAINYNEDSSADETEVVDNDVETKLVEEAACNVYASDYPRCLTFLSPANIQKAILEAKWDFQAIPKQEQMRDRGVIGAATISNALRNISVMLGMINHDPFHVDHMQHVMAAWSNLKVLLGSSLRINYVQRGIQRDIMLGVYNLWKWWSGIRELILGIVKSLSNPVSPLSNHVWLINLAEDVKTFYLLRTATRKEFNRPKYLANTTNMRHALEKHGNKLPETGDAMVSAVVVWMEEILLRWFEFPAIMPGVSQMHSFQNWDAQGRFLHILISASATEDVLLFNEVWSDFCTPLPALFGVRKGTKTKVSAGQWNTLESEVQAAFKDPQGQAIRAAIAQYARICSAINGGSTENDKDNVIPQSLYLNEAWDHATASIAAFLITLEPLIASVLVQGEHIPNELIDASNTLQRYVMGLTTEWPHKQLQIRHQDQHIPFRELAPSRAALRTIEAQSLQTRAGFYSLAVSRAITYGTSWTFLPKKVFIDAEDLLAQKEAVEALWNAEKGSKEWNDLHSLHICTTQAYGRAPNASRQFSNYLTIWGKTEGWEALVMEHKATIPWSAFLEWLRSIDMPQMNTRDSLTAFQLAVDLSYTGLVSARTPEEMGLWVFQMDKGAYRALLNYGLVMPKPAKSKPTYGTAERICTTNFVRLYQAVGTCLGPSRVKSMGFDVQMFEHTLCKDSRIRGEKQFNVAKNLIQTLKDTMASHNESE